MSRTPTLPPNDKTMWRKLVARTHPDAGGDHELFIWTGAVRDVICDGDLCDGDLRGATNSEPREHSSHRREGSTSATSDRVPFDPFADFESLTDRAVSMADAVAQPYADLLLGLAGCYPATDGPLYGQQRRGATFKQLAAIGHGVGMSKAERAHWYRIAESVPLSQRHAGHILSRLKRGTAA